MDPFLLGAFGHRGLQGVPPGCDRERPNLLICGCTASTSVGGPLLSHANAKLTLAGRKLIIERIQAVWRQADVAEAQDVSRATVAKWLAGTTHALGVIL